MEQGHQPEGRGAEACAQDRDVSSAAAPATRQPPGRAGCDSRCDLCQHCRVVYRSACCATKLHSAGEVRQQPFAALDRLCARPDSRLWPPSSADALRERGNALYKSSDFAGAEEQYSASLAVAPTAAAYANRAQARLKLCQYEAAELDCTSALALEKTHVKALQRRATARRELGRLLDAACDFDTASRLEPGNKALRAERADAIAAYEAQAGVSFTQPSRSVDVKPLHAPAAHGTEDTVKAVPSPSKTRGVITEVTGGEPWEVVRSAAATATVAAPPPAVPTPAPADASDAASPTADAPTEVPGPAPAPSPAPAPAPAAATALPPTPSTPPAAASGVAAAAVARLAAQPLRPPRNGAEFEAAWTRAAKNEDHQQQLLKACSRVTALG